MLTPFEIVKSVRGTLRLLRFDPAGTAYFDNTTEAFWRSFRVMVLAAPIYALVRLINYQEYAVAADEIEIVLVEPLYYVIQWFLLPVIAFEIARLFDLQRNYRQYIVAVNWINLMLITFWLGATLIRELVPILNVGFVVGVWLLLGVWFLAAARLMLGASWAVALGLFAFDLIVSEVLGAFVQRALGMVRL